eukprot:TRINITY_DN12583_c0_g1_i10.p1 TRINITY_DN12583_c0_g1~~TRINITY_DN12583_c0_g1_i10.p1  ORF type:complete len:398 (+),score=115.70 TRINITY_DN12583_c0_g1_i10:103-1296(+)
MLRSLVGSEMCIRDRVSTQSTGHWSTSMADNNKTLFGDSDDDDENEPVMASEPVVEAPAPAPEPDKPEEDDMSAVPVTPNMLPSPAPSEAYSNTTEEECSTPFKLPASNEAFIIEVCNPVVQDPNSMRAFVTYDVKSQVSHCEYTDSSYDVIRRYSDFEWLHGRLVAEMPHVNVPPLPGKASMGNLEMRFINLRQQMLSKFMIRLTAHEEILHSQGLKCFLTEKYGAEFDHAKKKLPAPREFQAVEKSVGLFARMKSKVTTSVPKELATPKCQEYFDYTLKQAKALSKLIPAGERYIARVGDLCKANGEMGVAMVEFGKSIEALDSSSTDTAISPLFDSLGECLQDIAEATTQAMYDEEALLVTNVTENCMLLNGAQRLFDARKGCLLYTSPSPRDS